MAKPKNQFDRYKPATDEVKARLFGLSVGEPGSRKTTFWLEGPSPIVVISLDQGLEGVVDRVLKDHPEKEIYISEHEWNPSADTLDQTEACDIRDKITEDFEHAIQNARTVIIDKETDLWGLFRYAEFGPDMNDAPRNYPALNQRYRRLINLAKPLDVNVGFIEGCKDEWVSSVNKKTGARGAASSGNRIRSGFGELDGLVHLCLHHTGISPASWQMQVGKARGPGGADVAGETYENLGFVDFAMMVFPDTEESDWQ